MAFVEIDRDSQPAFFANDLVQIVNAINNLHALMERTNARMQNMTTAQVETLYGVTDYGGAVKSTVSNAFGVLDTDEDLIEIRTQLG